MAKYYKISVSTPYCGTDEEHYLKFDEEPTDKELDEIAEEFCVENAESYEYLVFGWDNDPVADGEMSEDEYFTEIEEYYNSCDCSWEEIDQEEYEENS